jgi:hypothetical protein
MQASTLSVDITEPTNTHDAAVLMLHHLFLACAYFEICPKQEILLMMAEEKFRDHIAINPILNLISELDLAYETEDNVTHDKGGDNAGD